jgi:hypothetical protein
MGEVRKIINDCDFLGSATAGVEDEYDCLVAPLTTLLVKKTNREILRSFVEKRLSQHFGMKDASLTGNLETVLDKLISLQDVCNQNLSSASSAPFQFRQSQVPHLQLLH